MYVYAVTVGRGTGVKELSARNWELLIFDVSGTLSWAGTTSVEAVIEHSYGGGMWNGEREENATLTLRTGQELYPEIVAQIRTELRGYCHVHKQDAICLTIGQCELARPREDVRNLARR